MSRDSMKGWSIYVESKGNVDADEWERIARDYARWLSSKLDMEVRIDENGVKDMKELIRTTGLNSCPCTMVIQPSTLCPCALVLSDLRNRGVCMCGLYYLAPKEMDKLQKKGTSLLNEVFRNE